MLPIIQRLAAEIRRLYEQDNANAGVSIQEFLDRQLLGLDLATQQQFISLLVEEFSPPPEPEDISAAYLQQKYLPSLRSAAAKTIDRILTELDPEQPAISDKSGFMLGPMRKAHSFDRYCQVYNACKQWRDSGQAIEDFQKEFEQECHIQSQHPRR